MSKITGTRILETIDTSVVDPDPVEFETICRIRSHKLQKSRIRIRKKWFWIRNTGNTGNGPRLAGEGGSLACDESHMVEPIVENVCKARQLVCSTAHSTSGAELLRIMHLHKHTQ